MSLTNNEKQHISKPAKIASVILFVLGIACVGVGIYGYLMGDLNWERLQPIAKEVYAARREAKSFETPIMGTVDLFGEGRGTVPIALVSVIMNNAILIFL